MQWFFAQLKEERQLGQEPWTQIQKTRVANKQE